MLKAVASSAADATGVTSSAVLTDGEAVVGDGGARGVKSSKIILTIPATAATFTLTAAKTFAVTHSITLSGTDSTVMTFPSTSATIARTDAGQAFTGANSFGSSITYSAAAAGPVLKQGANGRVGTFVCNGVTPVTVNNTSIAVTDAIIISLNTVGGVVGAVPAIQTITAATGFTVAGTAADTSTYNYAIIKNAA